MAVSDERREWIEKVAVGGVYDDLSEEEHDALTDDDHDRPSREFFASVADPEELHIFVGLYNWDGGVEDLQRVVRHPFCDLGTAMLVYWRGQPGFYLQYADRAAVPDHAHEVYDLLREIEQRVAAGEYRTAAQPFDPAADEGQDQRPKPARVKRYGRDLPAVMYRAVAPDAEPLNGL
jgi:hypothetical protein